MKPVFPCLWFDTQAEEAARFYVSVFKKKSKVLGVQRMGPAKTAPAVSVTFTLGDAQFLALNGAQGTRPFTEATSFVITCKTQKEIDHFWSKLTANGGRESMCGWLQDKYGVSWQVVPEGLGELLRHPAALQAMLTMRKLDLKALKAARR